MDSEKFLYTSEVGRASQYKSAEKTVGTGKLTCTTDCDGGNRSAFGLQRTKKGGISLQKLTSRPNISIIIIVFTFFSHTIRQKSFTVDSIGPGEIEPQNRVT